ncbi:MAG: AAA family ATPase [Candidatus Planktophila sp.]
MDAKLKASRAKGDRSGMLPLPSEVEIKAGWADLPDDLIGISSLTLERYRCFNKLHIDLNPKLTVISAPNGQGKTAILDAVAISLRLFVDTLQSKRGSLGFAKDDVQLVAGRQGTMENFLPNEPTKLFAEAWFKGDKLTWARELRSAAAGAKTTSKDAKELSQVALGFLQLLQSANTIIKDEIVCTLPLISYYGTGRLFSQIKASSRKKPGRSRLDGYEDCLNPNSSYKAFLAWYGPMSSEAQAEIQSGLSAGHRAEERVKAVSGVIQRVLEPTGWKGIRWDFVNREPLAFHTDGRTFPVRLLSDGVRNMLALAADMAFRCSQLNPQLGANVANGTPGVVLIDEIDMHLHPEWQQMVLERLLEVFPKLQFIVSTHSSEVLSTVSNEHIRVVKGGEVLTPSKQTAAVSSDQILAEVMDVHPVWPKHQAAQWLQRYQALISQELQEGQEGVDLRQNLIKHFGLESLQILECDRLIRLQAFRGRLRSAKQSGEL